MTTRTITLTHRPPVTIDEDRWLVIAHGEDWEGNFRTDWNRRWDVRVRQAADGRTIVYGKFQTKYQGQRDINAGILLPANGNIIDAIRSVAAEIGGDDRLIHDTISDLPAEPLDAPESVDVVEALRALTDDVEQFGLAHPEGGQFWSASLERAKAALRQEA